MDRLISTRVEQDPFDYTFELETTTVNHGFVPEGLAFWRRWRKSSVDAAGLAAHTGGS